MFTDTHCHLAEPFLRFRLPEIVARCAAHNITQFVVPAITPNDWHTLISWQTLPEVRAVALGVHPWFESQYTPQTHDLLETYLQHNPKILVGEVGLDFHHAPQNKANQVHVLTQQLLLAKRHARPIVAHNVKSLTAFLQIVQATQFEYGGIAHAFSGSMEEANLLIKKGFKIGVGTLLLNPNAKKARMAAQNLPLRHLLIETDSPFFRKTENSTPDLLAEIAQELARLRGMDLLELSAILAQNLHEVLAFQAA